MTLCVQDRACLFGEIRKGAMHPNEAGSMIASEWKKLLERFPSIRSDSMVLMPNHLHGILILKEIQSNIGASPNVGAPLVGAPTLGGIIGAFKSITTVRYIQGVHRLAWLEFRKRLWQRNYFEHIIRHEAALQRIRNYIAANPTKWEWDRKNPTFMVS